MKYSAVVLEFGEPLLQLLGPDTPKATRKYAVSIVVLAWNAIVLGEALGTTEYLDELRRTVAALSEPGVTLFGGAVEELVARKRERFSDQRWTIGRWELRGAGGDVRLWVEARAAPTAGP